MFKGLRRKKDKDSGGGGGGGGVHGGDSAGASASSLPSPSPLGQQPPSAQSSASRSLSASTEDIISGVNGDVPGDSSSAAAGSSSRTDKKAKKDKDKDKRRQSMEIKIGQPSGFKHVVHVGANFEWSGEDKPSDSFQFLEKLGEGSYGVAYKAVHRSHGFVVAIKVVMMGPDKNEQAKLQRELDLLKRCRDVHVVSYFGSACVDQDMWILMEYCQGGSVRDILDKMNGGLKESQISAVCADTLLGLLYLQKLNIVHNDIKASNILLTEDGVAKIADFGVSEQLSSTLGSERRGVVGTPYWMAPEVILTFHNDFRSDIWSLGITAIELAEGFPPHIQLNPTLAMRMIPLKPSPKLTNQRRSGWSKAFHDFLAKCLDKDPTNRASAEQLLAHPFIKKGLKNSKTELRKLIAKAASQIAASKAENDKLMSAVVPGFETGSSDIEWKSVVRDAETGSTDSSRSASSTEGMEHGRTFIEQRPNIGSLFMFKTRTRETRTVGTQTDPLPFSTRLWDLFAGCCCAQPMPEDAVETVVAQPKDPQRIRRAAQTFTETDPLLR